MRKYNSTFGDIELTDERLKHILTFHPEIRSKSKQIGEVLRNPDLIRPSRRDDAVMIFYKQLKNDKWFAVVVKMNARHFVLTAYITSRTI